MAMRAVLVFITLVSAASLRMPEAEVNRMNHRLKAGQDLNREEPKHTKTMSSFIQTDEKKFKVDKVTGPNLLDLEDVQEEPSEAPFRPRRETIPSEWQVGRDSNVEVFWQRPKGAVKGIMFGATGCSHQGGDFFLQHQNGWEFKGCKESLLQKCQGLPDNVEFNKIARERGYLFITMTPQGRNSCYDHKHDAKRANLAVQYVLKKEGLPSDTQMYASGASAGGHFMFDMQAAGVPNLKCIAPQVAGITRRTQNEHLPTMLLYMPKDQQLRKEIDTTKAYLKQKLGSQFAVRKIHPWSVKELMLARGFSEEKATKVSDALTTAKSVFKHHKPIDENGYIVDRPGGARGSEDADKWWTEAVRPTIPYVEDSLQADHSVMHHLMQVAYAEHEFTAEYTDHIIDFCESGGLVDPQTPLRFNRKVDGTRSEFDVKASGVHGAHEESLE